VSASFEARSQASSPPAGTTGAAGAGGRSSPRQSQRLWLVAGLAGAVAAVVLWLAIAPLAGATADADAAACVLYFGQMTGGGHLPAFFPTTPKPLLTLMYGIAWWATNDWRSLTILTLVVAALGVGLAARLAARLAGTAAAMLVVAGLLAWPDFRLQVAGANSFIWGLSLWLLAAELIAGDRPRPWLAGIALLLAGLARTETVWLVLAAGSAAVALSIAATRNGRWAPARAACPLLLAVLALPIACLHDWLLTGQPLYWLAVPAGYTALVFPGLASASPLGTLHKEVAHYLPALPLVFLAAGGLCWLIANGRRAIPWALSVLAGGVLLTLVVLAWRAVYVSPRYYAEADAPILFAAAVGGGVLLDLLADLVVGLGFTAASSRGSDVNASAASPRPTPAGGAMRTVLAGGLAAVLSLVTVIAVVPEGDSGRQLSMATSGSAALQIAEPRLTDVLARASGTAASVAGVSYPVADPRSCRVFVPRSLLPRIAVEMKVPTTALGDSYLAFRNGDYSGLGPGQWVLHISAADGSGGVFAPFEISGPATMSRGDGTALHLVPAFVDLERGVWLIRVE
jgi:hypothetical protein